MAATRQAGGALTMRGRHRRLLPLIIAICVAVAVVPALGLYFFIRQDPDALLRDYLGKLEKRTGLAITFEDAGMRLFPLPALTLSQLTVKGPLATFSTGWLLLRPDYLALVRGKFAPARIVLLRPRLEAISPKSLDSLKGQNPLKTFLAGESQGSPLEIFGNGCGFSIEQGDIKITDHEENVLRLNGAYCDLDLGPENISGEFNFVTLNLRKAKKLVFSVERLTSSGNCGLKEPLANSNVRAAMQLRLPGIIRHGTLDLHLEGSPTIWDVVFSLKSDLEIEKASVPASLSGRLVGLENSPDISLRGLKMALDNDSGSLTAMFRPGGRDGLPELSGTLQFSRLSMTRWLGFARNLMPGLALALDNVTEGSLDFVLTPKGLDVPRIRACASNSCFSGSGSVKAFDDPNVYLDLTSDSVNLGTAIPEAIGNFPAAPSYSHPTLTPMPGKPLAPGASGIDYDINLKAKKVVYGPMKLYDGKVRITQGQMDRIGLEDVLIHGEAKGYGGAVKGLCILGAARNLPLAITAETTGMKAAELARDLPFLPLKGGLLKGKAEIKSSGKKLDIFLANLKGDARVEGSKPVFTQGGKNLELASLVISTQMAKGTFRQNTLGLDGKWQASVKDAGLDGKLTLNGSLNFGGKNGSLEFRGVPGQISLKLGEPWRKGSLAVQASGNFSAHSGRLEATKAAVEAGGLKAGGNFQLNYGKTMSWRGNFKSQTPNLSESLKKLLGKPLDLPEKLASLSLETEFSGTDGNLSLSGLNARLGPLAVAGRLAINYAGKVPSYDFNLKLGKVDLEQLSSKTGRNKKWDFSVFRSFNARGDVQIEELLAYSTRFQRLGLPISLQNGKLSAGPGSCVFYGSNLHLRGNADFSRNLGFGASLETLAFDLGKLCRDQKMKADLTGMANLRADVQATLTGPGQLPAALNGSWSFNIKDGSWRGRKSNGEPDGKPTMISRAGATGIIDRGVASFKNFQLSNDSLKADGSGWINLANQKLDCNFKIDMRGLPNFPLRLYGSIGKTKTSIGTGQMMLNAIAGLTGGIMDIFGGMLEGVLNIFR